MDRTTMPQSFSEETLAMALDGVRSVQTTLDFAPHGADLDLSMTLFIDGCTIGVIEVQDGFPVFVPNADWSGYVPRPMGD